MGSDHSTIDAELERFGVRIAPEDVIALAKAYAPDVVGAHPVSLLDIDRTLEQLADGVSVGPHEVSDPVAGNGAGERSMRSLQLAEQASSPASDVSELASARPSAGPLESEEIVLPEPVSRAEFDEESREIPLDAPAPRSGSFTVAGESEPEAANAAARTLEIVDEDELLDDGDDGAFEVGLEQMPSAPALSARAQFDTDRPVPEHLALDVEDGDREFAALFADASSHSALPDADEGRQVSRLEGEFTPGDDTDIFDSSVLGIGESEVPVEEVLTEELDSSEFEVMAEPKVTPPSAPPRPSKPPEKRPSFIGRLFGRKEDRDGPQS